MRNLKRIVEPSCIDWFCIYLTSKISYPLIPIELPEYILQKNFCVNNNELSSVVMEKVEGLNVKYDFKKNDLQLMDFFRIYYDYLNKKKKISLSLEYASDVNEIFLKVHSVRNALYFLKYKLDYDKINKVFEKFVFKIGILNEIFSFLGDSSIEIDGISYETRKKFENEFKHKIKAQIKSLMSQNSYEKLKNCIQNIHYDPLLVSCLIKYLKQFLSEFSDRKLQKDIYSYDCVPFSIGEIKTKLHKDISKNKNLLKFSLDEQLIKHLDLVSSNYILNRNHDTDPFITNLHSMIYSMLFDEKRQIVDGQWDFLIFFQHRYINNFISSLEYLLNKYFNTEVSFVFLAFMTNKICEVIDEASTKIINENIKNQNSKNLAELIQSYIQSF